VPVIQRQVRAFGAYGRAPARLVRRHFATAQGGLGLEHAPAVVAAANAQVRLGQHEVDVVAPDLLAGPAAEGVVARHDAACLFSCNFLLFYAAEASVPSGLVSVVFSTAVAFTALLAWLLEGRRPSGRVLAGAASGTAGVALLFAGQISQAGPGAAVGVAEALGGTLLFSLGNFAVRRATVGGADLPNAMARGMTWGSALLAGVALLRGSPVAPALTPTYLGGLAYLAVVASVLGFLAYLRLAARVGPERAAYATVTAPLVALAVSTGLEGYAWSAWSAWAVLGVPLVVLGNVAVFAPVPRVLAEAKTRPDYA